MRRAERLILISMCLSLAAVVRLYAVGCSAGPTTSDGGAVPDHYLSQLFGLAGKRAVVTGATGGLGAAMAAALAGAGAEVVVGGRDGERAERVVAVIREQGGAAAAVLGDLDTPDGVERFVADVGGEVDILLNSAGLFERAAGEQTPLALWERALAINATATFLLCQAFGRGMIDRGRGKIINVASTDGIVGVPEQVAYCASKGAVVQITRTLGAEWIRHGVNVNAIGPCDFDTPMIADALEDPDYAGWIVQAIPAGRIGQARELAGAAIYLASDASDMVAGHMLMVDGGRTII